MKLLNLLLLIFLIFLSCKKQNITEEARTLFDKGEYQSCLNLTKDLTTNELNYKIHQYRAWAFVQLGNSDSAASYEFNEVLKLDSNNTKALLGQMQFHPDAHVRLIYAFRYLDFQDDSSEIARTYQTIGHTYTYLENFNDGIIFFDSSIVYLGDNISNNESYIYYKKGLAQFYGKQYIQSQLSLLEYLQYRKKDSDAIELLNRVNDSILLNNDLKLNYP